MMPRTRAAAALLLLAMLAPASAAAQTSAIDPAFNVLAHAAGYLVGIGLVLGVGALGFAGARTYLKGAVDWAGLSSAMIGIFLIVLAVPFANWAAGLAGSPDVAGGVSNPTSTHIWNCMLCKVVFDPLTSSLAQYRQLAFRTLAAPAFRLAQIAVTLHILLWAMKLMMSPDEARNALPRFAQQMAWSVFAFGLLASPEWIAATVAAIEASFLNLGRSLLQAANATFSEASAAASGTDPTVVRTDYDASSSRWSGLWANVEATILPLLALFFGSIQGYGITQLGQTILAALLAVPFFFVAGVFLAFMIQTLFYITAIMAVAPLFIAGMMFQSIRGMLFSGLKFAAAGGVTLLVASIAMGITSTLIIDIVKTAGVDAYERQKFESQQCTEKLILGEDVECPSSPLEQVDEFITATLDAMFGPSEDTPGIIPSGLLSSEAARAILNPLELAFYITLGAGGVSVLLHLAAPRIASAIVGVADSATSAAIVVGLTQAGMGYAAARANGLALGAQSPFQRPWWMPNGGGGGASGGAGESGGFGAAMDAAAGLRGAGRGLGGGVS